MQIVTYSEDGNQVCEICGALTDRLYGESHVGARCCATCFGLTLPIYVGGEMWWEKAWRERNV